MSERRNKIVQWMLRMLNQGSSIVDVPENVEASTLMDGYVWWTCRACGNLQHTDKQVRYCADCGQRVKWEDAEG